MEKGKEFPVILGRNIGISPYQGFSLQTRFNSTIRINPTYPQTLELITWAKTNKDMLSSDALANFAGSSALIVNPIHQPIIPIAEVTTATSNVQVANRKNAQKRKEFDCPKCQQKTTLVPRCTFQIDLVDGSGVTAASISGDLAEKLLSMAAEDIYDTTCVKHRLLQIYHAQQMLSDRLFRIQLKKSFWKTSNVAKSNLTILSYTEKEHVLPLSIDKRNTKKAKSLDTSEMEMKASVAANETSSSRLSIESSTLAKKL